PVQLPAGTTSLPPLGGRLLAAYRLAWWSLVAAAVVTLAASWFDQASSGIWPLRTIKAVVLIAVSTILYRRRRTDPVAAMLAIAFLLWTISSSVDFLAASVMPAIADRLRFLFFALALLLFPDGDLRSRWTYLGIAVVAATFLLGLIEALGILPTSLYLPLAIGCVLAALVGLMVRYRALDHGVQKQQLKWIALGLFAGISLILAARAGAALTAGLPMPPVGSVLLEGLFQLGIIVLALGFLTSLLRFRLYDAEAAISRSAIYAALTIALVGTFAASEALIELLGQRFFGMAIGNVSGAVAAAVAAMMLTPLHGRISSWAEQYFQHDLVTLKEELPDLLAILSSGASVKRLAAAVLPRIEQAVHATRIALVVDGKLAAVEGIAMASARRLLRGWQPAETIELVDRNDDDAFPLRLALRCPLGRVRGWLLLGPRPDGSFYGRDDLEALTAIAAPLQRTLFLVAEREVEERRQRQHTRTLERAVNELRVRLDALGSESPAAINA
ncbi:MAG TPA: hypothetical protein VNJ05_08185, partial [Sphingomicrobium sp.]|nr:hypothetical protein [Sphingomicrobium sp.]